LLQQLDAGGKCFHVIAVEQEYPQFIKITLYRGQDVRISGIGDGGAAGDAGSHVGVFRF
jgi:hypothetical protein